ncbi:ankyrin repeat-containing protein At5g02620-like [Impatiens glandulifera]|uniref:ankyrin repeat-containing protein At5g02620-like n=1 Tax=Impatiens glandulifera TaxID=253017 RepID=UPI001FB103D9|nr:ankyrin repeat-containing protein At5g02620-like [Impatiens glandulifera]XP_047322225.1 ankyrin repeat-containing protein At5g02620-like [Impatiens glandulifera]
MESHAKQEKMPRKKMVKQLTGKRDDTSLHLAARGGQLTVIMETIAGIEDDNRLSEVLCKQNQSGETALYVAAEYGYAELVREMIKYYDIFAAGIKARNGLDALHIAARQGDLDVVKALMEAYPELSMTVDTSNTTALNTAATQGHKEVVDYLLCSGSGLAAIAKSNGKTALHSAARNGHTEVVKALLRAEPAIATREDKKGQTALHMSVKGLNIPVVEALLQGEPSLINMVDNKGNTALHIATRKGRAQIVEKLLGFPGLDKTAVNRYSETAIDTAEKTAQPEIQLVLRNHGVVKATELAKQQEVTPARELKQTVCEIKNEVHDQLEHARQTRKRVQGIAKRINKMHSEGLNNAINSTTVVAVLIATVAFAAIFTVPGQFADDPNNLSPGISLGEANISATPAFAIFFIFDSFALFLSLAVVIVQTSVVVIESKAKKKLMMVINKLMWVACLMISVAFLALTFTVVGVEERWLAVAVTIIGSTIMISTLGLMSYWVVRHRIEDWHIRKNSRSSRSSWSRVMSVASENEAQSAFKNMYAI